MYPFFLCVLQNKWNTNCQMTCKLCYYSRKWRVCKLSCFGHFFLCQTGMTQNEKIYPTKLGQSWPTLSNCWPTLIKLDPLDLLWLPLTRFDHRLQILITDYEPFIEEFVAQLLVLSLLYKLYNIHLADCLAVILHLDINLVHVWRLIVFTKVILFISTKASLYI